MANKQKLELTWIGKDNPEYDIANIEPRILEENPELSNCANDPETENMIIHGDNLLALKALLPEYAGKVKCIYIDPPYNTGNAFEHYDDNVEHSTWLSLMKPRLELLRMLLREDGCIYIHLDDNESDYLKVLLDEIFGRKNFINRITIEARSPSAFSTVNPGVFKSSEYIIWYSKNKNSFSEKPVRVKRLPNYAYNKWIDNPEEHYSNWIFRTVSEAYESVPKPRTGKPEKMLEHYNRFIIQNAKHIWRATEISDTGAGKAVVEMKRESIIHPGKIFVVEREKFEPIYILNGAQISFYSKNVHTIDGELVASTFLTNIWTDIAWEGIAKEGCVSFKKSKKPEKLVRRCFDLASNPNDLVLDSFLGSGTTAAVAQKMGRKYIGIEMGEHAYTHCTVRLDKVIDGSDQGGISKALDWKGGGAYKFYELAPSFIARDEFGNAVIDTFYDDAKLIKAMCKLMNFTYAPSKTDYWKHGAGQSGSFLYVTTQYLTSGMVRQIAEHLGAGESLLIAPKTYESGAENIDSRITIRKIPQSVLRACHYGKKDYLLPIKETKAIEELEEEE